jgi:hypothetical protein
VKKIQVFYWVKKIHRGREDWSDEPWLRWAPKSSLDMILTDEPKVYPNITARKLAHCLGISVQIVISHFHNSLGTRRYHLRWFSHRPDDSASAVSERFTEYQLSKLIHPPYSLGLSAFTFFPFICLRENTERNEFRHARRAKRIYHPHD